MKGVLSASAQWWASRTRPTRRLGGAAERQSGRAAEPQNFSDADLTVFSALSTPTVHIRSSPHMGFPSIARLLSANLR